MAPPGPNGDFRNINNQRELKVPEENFLVLKTVKDK
jgi:hypothetical protein